MIIEMKYSSCIHGAFSPVGKKDAKQVNVHIETMGKCQERKHGPPNESLTGSIKLLNCLESGGNFPLCKGHLLQHAY